VGAIAGGAAAYVTMTYDPTTAMEDGKGQPVLVMVGGSAILGGSVYLWLREARSTSRLAAGLLGAGVAALAAGTVLFVTDQDPGPALPPTIRNSAPTGVALGVAGVALAGLGAWFVHREEAPASLRLGKRAAPWSPVVLVRSSTALLGCAGSF
jgi:amino acid transporter